MQSQTLPGSSVLQPDASPVIKIIGVFLVSGKCAKAAAISRPDIPGITMSRRIMSGDTFIATVMDE
ncbi:MAG: hypothetical protein FWC70_10395 [Defluviitaleaceae bacterium]|nr:hypothetical protein [Defluviitaleaceae bacterium]